MSDRHPARATGFLLRLVWLLCLLVAFFCLASGWALAQFGQIPAELADVVRVDEPDPMVRTHLERVRVNIAEKQWDEAIEGLRQLMENHGERLLRLDPQRFVPLRDFGHIQLADLPPEGLALYRGRVDAQAERWLNEGLKQRDAGLLQRVVDELFASSFGDDALFALGEIALERGEYHRARSCWERISPELRTSAGSPLWVSPGRGESSTASLDEDHDPPPTAWLAYPDTDLNLAEVRARLVLVSLFEGAVDRAEIEYKSLVKLHADARGRLAGREGLYRETLDTLLKAARDWQAPPSAAVATTFGGTPTRNFIADGAFALRSLAWAEPIPFFTTWQAHVPSARKFVLPERRVAEDVQGLLSYHPLVVGDLVVFHDLQAVYVFNLRTGKPAWAQSDPKIRPGQVYPRSQVGGRESSAAFTDTLGVPRFTATVAGSWLFVRLGSQTTSWPEISAPDRRGSLVILDLAQQGKLIAEMSPENERWSFEGPPVCDGSRFYVAMRYNDVRPQAHVACYEIVTVSSAAGTIYKPVMRWRRMVCAAESPAQGSAEEITHNLLTLAEGTLFLNTNLGAVASLSGKDGRIHWVSTYPRAKRSDNTAHFFRDLNPCVYYRGTLYVAPTDSPQVFAIDAMTGLLRWASEPRLSDIMHLLGVAEGRLIASGKQLWWLDAETGKLVIRFPDNLDTSYGYGRGMLIGDAVVWPTREMMHVFYQKQSSAANPNQRPAAPQPAIKPFGESPGLSGGNLVAAGEYVLLAMPDKLWAFGPRLEENRVTKAK